MNNEEKILALLEKHGEMLEQITGRLDKVDSRLDRIETVQAQHGEKLDELDTRSLRSAVLLETEVARDIHLVFEGQELLRQKMEELTPIDRTEALEGDVAVLKDAYKLMRQEINELKKAQ